ncbi:hypothetical protein HK096_000335 [Nowakowskiella sp. JEL0078]|nr:hypothetical protein HK096_000335 [Nowakowskiella sp. JEL0078]
MKIKVLYFASSRDSTGISEEVYVLDGMERCSLSELTWKLLSRHEELRLSLKSFLIAVNLEYVERTAWLPALERLLENMQVSDLYSGFWEIPLFFLKDGDEVAIIPPVSGG